MAIELHCAECNIHLGTVRDGRIRQGMLVCYCTTCSKRLNTAAAIAMAPLQDKRAESAYAEDDDGGWSFLSDLFPKKPKR